MYVGGGGCYWVWFFPFLFLLFHIYVFSCTYILYGLQKVILDRSVGKLGLSIIGGSEHASRVFGGGRPGVYVSKVSPMLPGPHPCIYMQRFLVFTCVC